MLREGKERKEPRPTTPNPSPPLRRETIPLSCTTPTPGPGPGHVDPPATGKDLCHLRRRRSGLKTVGKTPWTKVRRAFNNRAQMRRGEMTHSFLVELTSTPTGAKYVDVSSPHGPTWRPPAPLTIISSGANVDPSE